MNWLNITIVFRFFVNNKVAGNVRYSSPANIEFSSRDSQKKPRNGSVLFINGRQRYICSKKCYVSAGYKHKLAG